MNTYRGAWTKKALACLDLLMEQNDDAIETASQWCTESILADGMVHLFGSGHSRIPVEEMFPRYGSYPGFNPLVELSTTFHTQIVGSNGQRQAMFIERVPGLAAQVLDNYTFPDNDVFICFSVSGTSALPVEMAEGCRARGLRTIAVTAPSDENRLAEAVDLVIALPVSDGDALVEIDGLETPVGPVSTFLYAAVVNEIKVRTAAGLVAAGRTPPVITGKGQVGAERSAALFDAAYAEHARLASRRVAGAATKSISPTPLTSA